MNLSQQRMAQAPVVIIWFRFKYMSAEEEIPVWLAIEYEVILHIGDAAEQHENSR